MFVQTTHGNVTKAQEVVKSSYRVKDPNGAACYIIAVLLVYSISIVALIMSRIKRKHVKLLEDREIHKYLREFQAGGGCLALQNGL